MSQDFLVELGTEELPPKALKTLANAFKEGIEQGLKAADLEFASIKALAAPRRLAVIVTDLADTTPKKESLMFGPPAKIAFDAEGKPTKAAEAFAQKNGLSLDQLTTQNDGKVEKLAFTQVSGGEPTTDLLADLVSKSLAALPIPKRMRWGATRTEFVRPAHWLVMLFGKEVVSGQVLGLNAGNLTRGHRFHCNQTLEVTEPSQYVSTLLQDGFVQVDFEQRQAEIRKQVEAEAEKIGGIAVIEDDLLDEVTALVEWPVALTGRFDEAFLEVPAEALISSMSEHQKYFHVVDSNGKLLPNFITVANIVSQNPDAVIDGNERVIRPRLADAAFFFETDKKHTLDEYRDRLKTIVFQAKLGTLFEKTERVAGLASAIAAKLGYDATKAARAGELCKSDLASEMVLEFDKMQGIAGRYYALNQQEDGEVAEALAEQYLPKFAGDKLPKTNIGTVLALADRLDTLAGIFGIGEQPTGSKDPFALRRASLAVLRLLVENKLDLDLNELLGLAIAQYSQLPKAEGLQATVVNYMIERLKAWYEDANISAEIFQSVNAKGLSTPTDIDARIAAVAEFTKLEAATALAAANKRVSNILAKNETEIVPMKTDLLVEDAEIALANALADITRETAPLFAEQQYTQALTALAALRAPVDRFFDEVMVMAEDDNLRNNRMALLQSLRDLFLQVADISYLVPAK